MSNHPSVPPSSSPPTTPPSNNDSQPPLNLKYHVIQCSSEDSNHPCTNLHSYNTHSQGWQSSSYCDYPQSMTIQFEGQVRLKRIKILSHEYKISSKIELFIGVQSDDDDEDNDDDTHNIHHHNNNNNNNNNLHESNSNNNESHKNCETNNNNILKNNNNNYTTVENNNAKKWLRLLSHHDHDSDDSFKRIGFLSLSNNEKSGYSARELKKVKLDVRCTCMKLVFHSNFVNKKNIFNQIGIVGMQFIGQVLSMFPSNALNPIIIHHHNNGSSNSSSSSRNNSRNDSSRNNSGSSSSSSRNKSNIPQKPLPLPTIIGQSSNNVIPGTSDYSSIMLDEETQIRIEELNILKSRAVQEEDFMRAQSIKDQIDLLKQASIQLSELEKQKLIAIEREDYVRAHRLKQEMISIRSNILERRDGGGGSGGGGGGVPSHQQQPVSTPPPFTNNHHNTRNNHVNNNVVVSSALSSSENDSEQETDASTAIITTTTMDHSVSPPPPPPQQQQQQQQRKRNVLSSDEEEQRVFNTNNSAWVDPNVPFDNRPIKPMNTNQMFSPPSPPENLKNDLQAQTTMAAKDTSDNNSHALRKKRSKRVDPHVDHSKHQVQQPNSYDEKPIQGLNENALESDENESMKSQKRQNLIPESIENTILANMEEWERAIARRIIEECSDRMVDPGPLPKNDKFIDIVEVFGDYVTRCLLSQKSRGLRESSVLVLTQNLEQLPHDKIMIVMGALSFLKIGLKDKIPAIYHANIEFLKQVIKFGSKAVKRSHIASCMEPVLSILATKISDSNSRTRDAAEKTLQFLSTRASVGASSVCDSCLKIPKDEQAGWKPVVARTNMIIFLTKKYGFSEKSGLNTQKVSNIITKGLNNPNVEARKAALELYLESFKVDPSIQHLSIQYEKSKPILYREMIEITSRKEDEYSHESIVEVSDDPPSRGTPTKRKRKVTKQSDAQNKQEEEPPQLDQQVISSFECLNPEEMHGCDFCGEKFPDDTFVNWHWMFYCRLLTPCPLCVQIVMIEQFNYHLETECEKREAVQFCQKCDEPVVPDHQDVHDSYCQPRPQNSAIRCPLCKVDFTSMDHFYEHLFGDQCQNIRADPRESGAEFDDMYHQWMHYREEHNIK